MKKNDYLINLAFNYINYNDINEFKFYFYSKREDIIFSHLPEFPKWELLNNPITIELFQKKT